MRFELEEKERKLLREIQRNEKYKREYVKVTVLLMLDLERLKSQYTGYPQLANQPAASSAVMSSNASAKAFSNASRVRAFAALK